MQTPEFRGAYQHEARRLLDYAGGRVRAGVDATLDALGRNLRESAPPAIQVSAARAWLDYARQCEVADLEWRIAALETLLRPAA